MAYTLAGGFVLGSLFNYISASAFVFAGHFGLSASQFSYLFAGNSVALVLGGAISNWLLGQGRQAGGIMLTGIGAHARAGASVLSRRYARTKSTPGRGCEGRGAATGWAPESTSRTIASLACLRLRISPSTLSGSCIPALEGRAPDSRTRP